MQDVFSAVLRKKKQAAALACVGLIVWSISGADEPIDLSEQIQNYCHRYAAAATTKFLQAPPAAEITVTGVKRTLLGRLMTGLNNAVSPPHARVEKTYRCRFQVAADDVEHKGQVDLIFIRDRGHAEYAQWEKIQLLDLGEQIAEGDRAYYVVTKYLKIDGHLMHLRQRE